ncbi:hypothetical protein J2S19_001126 [Metabacillus malikii]|uniref:Uncharacterized protein n=1 Tax=Metabacillus malikii TaxID=1504265 RepID=A0ABT9ZC88_9BACI|nr:hypothetical protein [Metabacillus malikii]
MKTKMKLVERRNVLHPPHEDQNDHVRMKKQPSSIL